MTNESQPSPSTDDVRRQASAQEVRNFYAADLPRRVRTRVHGNLRIDRAVEFMTGRVDSSSKILDIGCGIGVATEKLAHTAHAGQVWGIDISPAHIDYCRRTIEADNLTFRTLDIVEDFASLKDWIDAPVDVITMVDVIEHLPRDKGRDLFEKLSTLLSDDGAILLTYPSPSYQRHLYTTDGARLQAIDLIVEFDDIQVLADRANCQIRHFSHVDVWRRNQYIHCELSRRLDCEPFDIWDDWSGSSVGKRAQMCTQFLRQKARRLLRPLRHYKYVINPTRDNDSS